MAPRVLRELSWAAGKLREVARVLSALEVRLTVDPEYDKMTGLEPVGQEPRAMSLAGAVQGEAEPEQLWLKGDPRW